MKTADYEINSVTGIRVVDIHGTVHEHLKNVCAVLGEHVINILRITYYGDGSESETNLVAQYTRDNIISVSAIETMATSKDDYDRIAASLRKYVIENVKEKPAQQYNLHMCRSLYMHMTKTKDNDIADWLGFTRPYMGYTVVLHDAYASLYELIEKH